MSSLLDINTNTEPFEATRINLDDWVRFGGGANGWSYNHKTDDSVILKLNSTEIPVSRTMEEYRRSKKLYEMGVNCPKVIDFVTDGERYGLITEKVKGKKSFVKIISEDPSQLESLAKDFAYQARKFHEIRCDEGEFPSYYMNAKKGISECEAIPDDLKASLLQMLESLDKEPHCIHGDMNPGNIIRAQGKDYWIDLGEVCYGDPDVDFVQAMFIADHMPRHFLKYLFHITKEQFQQFKDVYARAYYGQRWETAELQEKLHKVLCLKAAMSIVKRPKASIIYLPLLRGQKKRYKIIMSIMDVVLRKKN